MMETLLNLDENLYMLINSGMSNALFDSILIPFRHKLFWIPLYLALICFIVMNYGRYAWITLVALIMTVVVADGVSSKLIKKTIKRTRPCHIEHLHPQEKVHCSNGFSFTSSHAANHFAMGSFLFLLLSMTNWKWTFIAWATLIGFAQIYVGVHYPSDVVVGSLLGILIGKTIYIIYNKIYLKLSIKYLQS